MLQLNTKRTPKPSGKKKKIQPFIRSYERPKGSQEDVDVEDVEQEVPEKQGPAQSQANPFTKDNTKDKSKTSKNIPEFIDTFTSSNIDAIAYDPKRKQLWVRFVGKDVYTYYDVPLTVYRGFWSAPSKGHYFWEKIRKNKHIKYQKLTASLHWIPYAQFGLNANKQANVAAIAKAFKKLCKRKYPDWGPEPLLQDVFNGKRILLENVIVEVVGYGNKVRVNLINPVTKVAEFGVTDKTETSDVVDYIVHRVNYYLTNRALSTLNSALRIEQWQENVKELYRYLTTSMQVEHWQYPTVLDEAQAVLESDHFGVELANGDTVHMTINDSWSGESHDFELTSAYWISEALSYIYAVALQGDLG